MPLPIIPILGILLTGGSLVAEYLMYTELDRASSQLIDLLNAIEYGTDFDTFLSECWLFILLGIFAFWGLLAFAFPKKKGGGIQ